MKEKLEHFPWDRMMLYFWKLRRTFFNVDVPDNPVLVVEEDEEYLRGVFRKEHFMVSWPFSYKYEGEKMNMVRPEFEDDDYMFYQTHVRAFETDEGYALMAHYELDPTDYPREHIQEVNMDVDRGMEKTREILERHEIEYKVNDGFG